MKPEKRVYTMNQYTGNIQEGYITNDADTQRCPKWKPIVDGLAVTILTEDYIPPLILAKDKNGQIHIVDGGSRTAAFMEIRYGNYKIKSSVEEPVIKYKKKVDDNGNITWEDAEFDIRNKTFEQFPKELQRKFDEFQVETVIYENCDKDGIARYLKRFNLHAGMNANQKMFLYIPNFAHKVREITKNKFFVENKYIKDTEKENGVVERVICEATMLMFHHEEWNKNSKKVSTYLNENSNEDEFDKLDKTLTRLENILEKHESARQLFTTRDCFVWIKAFDNAINKGITDEQFGEFLDNFVNDNKADEIINEESFNSVDKKGSTKDKKNINLKLSIIDTLINQLFDSGFDLEKENINKESDKNTKNDVLSFVQKNIDEKANEEDIEFYSDCLKDWTVGVPESSKMFDKENKPSMIGIAAYATKKNIDDEKMIEWFEKYADSHNTYLGYQMSNYMAMRNDLVCYCE